MGDERVPRAHDRAQPRDDARPPARDRAARRLRSRHAARLRPRQHRGLPAVRMAAAAQGDRARLSAGVPDRAAGPGARPDSARPRRRALPGHPDGDAVGALLVRLDGHPGRLVPVRERHARPVGAAGREPAARLPGGAGVRRRAGRADAVRGVAAPGPRDRRAGAPGASARQLAALALRGRHLAPAVHRLGDAVLHRRRPAAAADRAAQRPSRGGAPAAAGGQRGGRRRRAIARRRHRSSVACAPRS